MIYLCYRQFSKRFKEVNSTILIPEKYIFQGAHKYYKMYNHSYQYESYLKNLFSIKAITNTLN